MVWNADPILFSLGPVTVRWYGLLFVIGFMLSFQGLKKIFARDGYAVESLDSLLIHIMIGTIVGARLGHYPAQAYRAAFLVLIALQLPGLALFALRRFHQQLQPLADLACADEALPGMPAVLAGRRPEQSAA